MKAKQINVPTTLGIFIIIFSALQFTPRNRKI